MTTSTAARQLLRSVIEGGNIVNAADQPVPLRWQNENVDSAGNELLADPPAPFVFSEFTTSRGTFLTLGGGRGNNIYRAPFQFTAYVFVPKNDFVPSERDGLEQAEAIAEQIAALFRSFYASGVSCTSVSVEPGGDGADLKPPGLHSEVGNYFWACADIAGHFDQIA